MSGFDVTSGNALQARVNVDTGLSSAAVGRPAEIAAGASAAGSSGAVEGRDKAQLSGAAGLAAASAEPGVREAKVAALQQTIAAGTYSVPTSAVADKLIEHLLG
jgi:flagellar biosynthesis anti-sigma factor FlgM